MLLAAAPGLVAAMGAWSVPAGPDLRLTQPVRANGVQLIMVDDPACHYCRKWNAEVGRGYGRTAEGRAAPLRRVRRGAAQLKDLAPVIYTPTFVLTRNGGEVGRITGYPGQMYFWEELNQMLTAAGLLAKN